MYSHIQLTEVRGVNNHQIKKGETIYVSPKKLLFVLLSCMLLLTGCQHSTFSVYSIAKSRLHGKKLIQAFSNY